MERLSQAQGALSRSLDVQQEEAQKAFELVDLALSTGSDLITGMSNADIHNDEAPLNLQLQKLANQIPSIQSIWIYDKNGRALVSSWLHPPPDRSFSDPDFFAAHVQRDVGTYYDQVYPSVFDAQPFFSVSRRLERNGEFISVIEASVLPSNFFRFFATLAYGGVSNMR